VLRSGDLLDQRYRLVGHIATGGMGEVWRATDVTLGRMVAVKVLHPALVADPVFDARFAAEARILAALTHPNVVNVYDYGHAAPDGGGATYLVMSYVDGMPLSRCIAEAGRLSVPETASVIIQAAKALHAAHRGGIIHCDVKPANLLVAIDGTVILVDFGAARPASARVVNVVLGTPLYVAPEQVTDRAVTAATDVYALGAVAYHCLTGGPPFTGMTPLQIAMRHVSDKPSRLPSDIPRALRRIIARAMSKDPVRRVPHRGRRRHCRPPGCGGLQPRLLRDGGVARTAGPVRVDPTGSAPDGDILVGCPVRCCPGQTARALTFGRVRRRCCASCGERLGPVVVVVPAGALVPSSQRNASVRGPFGAAVMPIVPSARGHRTHEFDPQRRMRALRVLTRLLIRPDTGCTIQHPAADGDPRPSGERPLVCVSRST
jgi:eukaryotic-like serine/threonine-protein kinase